MARADSGVRLAKKAEAFRLLDAELPASRWWPVARQVGVAGMSAATVMQWRAQLPQVPESERPTRSVSRNGPRRAGYSHRGDGVLR